MDRKHPLAHCEQCPLAPEPAVYGTGPQEAEYVVVGEAPGKDETRSGIPFVGKAGRLLDKVLAHHDIQRDSVYLTNAVLCRPPENRTPTAKEAKCCRDRLVAEVKERKPKAVLALGASAAKSLLGSNEGITKLRLGGSRYSEELETDVVPTFHTAAALRDPGKFPTIISDVRKLKERIGTGWEPTDYIVADKYNAPQILANQLQTADDNLLSLDIEVDKRSTRHAPEWLCIGISHAPKKAVVYPRETISRIAPVLEQGFQDKRLRWVMQNGKFDTQYLWSIAPSAHHTGDTMLAHYATDERIGTHKLETLATEILGAPFYKTEFRDAAAEEDDSIFAVEVYEQNRDITHRYNATDADVTRRLYYVLEEEMRKDGVEDMYRKLLIPGSNALCHVEYEGIRVDLARLAVLEDELETLDEALEAKTSEWVSNPRSWQQIQLALGNLGYRVPDTRKDTLKPLEGKEEFVKHLLAYKENHKVLSTYVRGLRKYISPQGRIHSTFTLHVAETGRLSSRRPNLQNFPIDKPIREVFVADDEDSLLIETDYQQIELRLAAVLSGDPWLKQQFKEGKHIHKAVAKSLFGPSHSPQQYVKAKSLNFGILYGESAKHLAMRLGISTKEAQAMIDAFFKRSPKLLEYRKVIERDVAEKGYITSYFGRKRRFWLVTYDNRYDVLKEAYNFPLQSAASDITLLALIELRKKGITPRITVHDSLVVPAKASEQEEVSRVVVETMESVNPFDVPIPVDIKADYRWRMKEGG